MPANAQEIDKVASYYHIANTGSDQRDIFKDAADFQTFLDYINEYLNPPVDPKSVKKEFTVNGKVYRGSPRLPKNYHGKIELVAYSLTNKSFNLLLKENESSSIQALVRSLCTRYSIYYNKKYQRSGAVFAGPYKAKHIEDNNKLLNVIGQLHQEGTVTSADSYKDIAIPQNVAEVTEEVFTVNTRVKKKEEPKTTIKYLKVHQRIPEMFALGLTFLLLVTIGFRNVQTNQTKVRASVAGVSTEASEYKTLELEASAQKIGLASYGGDYEYVTLSSDGMNNTIKQP